MLKAIGVVMVTLAVLAAGVIAYAATRPDTFRVQRTTTINAAPETVFALINDFERWPSWSPYEKKDPAMKRSRSGAAAGQGAVYEWSGDSNVGQGRMEILEAKRPEKVLIKLDFLRPFEAHNMAEFTMVPRQNATEVMSTEVTWAIYGPNLFIGKVMSLVFNMDKMIGTDFEAGLANLKAIAEKQASR
jgi:uncharacterized protein YndB with AHSA1/START domain